MESKVESSIHGRTITIWDMARAKLEARCFVTNGGRAYGLSRFIWLSKNKVRKRDRT